MARMISINDSSITTLDVTGLANATSSTMTDLGTTNLDAIKTVGPFRELTTAQQDELIHYMLELE